MIHAIGHGVAVMTNYIRLDLYDKYAFELGTPDFSFNPLVKIRSQETNQEKIFIVTAVFSTYAQRYLSMTWVANNTSSELLTAGILVVGTRDFPYGVYDITIWENSTSTNLNPQAVFRTLHMGLMTLSAR